MTHSTNCFCIKCLALKGLEARTVETTMTSKLDLTLFQDFHNNLKIKAEVKQRAAEETKERQLKVLLDILVKVVYPCGRSLCEELQDSVKGTSSGLTLPIVSFWLHKIEFTHEVKDTSLGPRIQRTMTVAQDFITYRDRNRDTCVEGADFGMRYLADDVTEDSVRAHAFACLKEVLAYEYKDKI